MFVENKDINKRYNSLAIQKYNEKPFETSEPKPLESDYKIGFIYRYFIRKRNEVNGLLYEINVNTYRRYLKDVFYIPVRIRWKISGEQNEVETANRKSISFGKNTISNLDTYIKNYSKFWKR